MKHLKRELRLFLTEETANIKTLRWEEAWSITANQAGKDGWCDWNAVHKGHCGTGRDWKADQKPDHAKFCKL